MERKTLLLLIPLSVIAAVLIAGLLVFLGIYPLSREFCGCHHMVPTYFFLVFGILLILAAVPLSYYFTSRKMEDKLDKQMNVLSKFIGRDGNRQKNADLAGRDSILRFLNPNEQKILERLLESEGDMLQSEISRMDNMTKLKAHRAVKNLEQKGVIRTQHHGKTKKISLTKEIKKSFDV